MSAALLQATLEHLERLVAFDTRNPPRAIDRGGIFKYLGHTLTALGLACELVDLGEGCLWLLATRGDPRLLINVHVDTVPADPRWPVDPLRLRVDLEVAQGLGACDIKGAAAAILAALPGTTGPCALLFSSDEEAGSSRCVRDFLAAPGRAFPEVLVAEPTSCRAVAVHRGIASATASFTGLGGHASAARALHDSAIHEAVRWASSALALAAESEAAEPGPSGLRGLRLNLGAIAGGQKPNMIAAAAELRLGVRPPPELPPRDALARLAALAGDPGRLTLAPGFVAPPLPSAPPGRLDEVLAGADALAARLGLERGPAVDFWTEAALFSEAGAKALVFGPGSIDQAHTAGEWVALTELAAAAATYRRIFSAL
ncbi:MAG: acetylornithine deacetylase [Nannocystaceae bacterium]